MNFLKVQFRERNPIPIAIIGIIAIVSLLVVGFQAGNIKFFANRTVYHADFVEAAGLVKDNEVRIAGVRVGNVSGVVLEGTHVKVTFRVDAGQHLGDLTEAEIKLKTLLGTKFLALHPKGEGRLADGATIPVERTTVPYQVYDAFGTLSTDVDTINLGNLSKALDTLSGTFADPQGNAQSAIKGLGRLSTTIASRDAELASLLSSTRQVTAELSARDADLIKLLGDADLVLRVVIERRAVIDALLKDTSALAVQLVSLVRDNRAQIDPLLVNLHAVAQVLQANLKNLDRSAALLGPFARYNANATGNGRWIDVYGENLLVSDKLLCSLSVCK